jgi:hypothetical protein
MEINFMRNRSVLAVVLLPFVTLGIYTLYWFVSTKGELNNKGASIPTAWLLIIPLVNIWWMWKYFEGAEQVTNNKVNGVLMFVLALLVTSLISSAICQDTYNKLDSSSASDTNQDTISGEVVESEPTTAAPSASSAENLTDDKIETSNDTPNSV